MKTIWQFIVFGTCSFVQASTYEDSELNSNTKIINGNYAQRGEFPFIVQILVNGSFTCGGTIINEYWILTAAHCYETPLETTSYTVVAGEYDTRVNEGSEQSRKVTRIVIHPNYYMKQNSIFKTPVNDVAVWKVSEPFRFNIYVQPATLARNKKPLPSTFNNIKNPVAAGWGKQSFFGSPSQVLKKVIMPIIATPVCALQYMLTPFSIEPGVMCAGSIGGGDCKGDSGGPLVQNNEVIGVVSFGLYCTTAKPSGFSDVAYFYNWIISEATTTTTNRITFPSF